MPAYVLTGAPGAGKTAVLRLLEICGYAVVEEAATDVIALGNALGREEPWHDHDFIDKVITLQRRRQDSVRAARGATVFCDRSPVCTLALSRFLGCDTSPLLAREVGRVVAERAYETTVFLIRNQGSVQPTAARRISFEDSLVFEQLHEQAYRELGFQLVEVPAGPLPDRVALIRETLRHLRPADPAGIGLSSPNRRAVIGDDTAEAGRRGDAPGTRGGHGTALITGDGADASESGTTPTAGS